MYLEMIRPVSSRVSMVKTPRKERAVPEILKNQRFQDRPELGKVFTEAIPEDKGRRNHKIEEALKRYG